MGTFTQRFSKSIFEFDMTTGKVRRAITGLDKKGGIGIVKYKNCVYFASMSQKSAEKKMLEHINKIKENK